MHRAIPIFLIIIPIISFFVSAEEAGKFPKHTIGQLAQFLFTIPWYFKILSILIGSLWLFSGSTKQENQK